MARFHRNVETCALSCVCSHFSLFFITLIFFASFSFPTFCIFYLDNSAIQVLCKSRQFLLFFVRARENIKIYQEFRRSYDTICRLYRDTFLAAYPLTLSTTSRLRNSAQTRGWQKGGVREIAPCNNFARSRREGGKTHTHGKGGVLTP